jgi:hypothetical protein
VRASAMLAVAAVLSCCACSSPGEGEADGVADFQGVIGSGVGGNAPISDPATAGAGAFSANPSTAANASEQGVNPEGIAAQGGATSTAAANQQPGAAGSNGQGVAGASAQGVAGASAQGAGGSNTQGIAGAASASGGAPGTGGAPAVPPAACPARALFCDDFEDDVAGRFPGAPWQNNTGSGATVTVDGEQAFSGTKAVHVNAPPGQSYRRGYFSLGQGSPVFPAASREMFGRAMLWLDATPNAVVHWTIIQAEGPAASGTHTAYYRYGGQQQNGAGFMANYETTNGVSTDCYSHSATRMPVQTWACVEWHFAVATNEMQLWLNGRELTDMHVIDRPSTPGSGCLGNDVNNGEWLAPPAFQTLHLGWESYQQANNDRNLWVDDVVISTERVGCPAP